MDDALKQAYAQARYRVRRSSGGYHEISLGDALPAAMANWVGDSSWGFLTAWNPRSQQQPHARNRSAQRRLCNRLQALQHTVICAGEGVALDGSWREPSLFVVGAPLQTLEALARGFYQAALLAGCNASAAALIWIDD